MRPLAAAPRLRIAPSPALLLAAACLLVLSACGEGDRRAADAELPRIDVPAEPGALQEALAGTRGPARLVLAPGEHVLVPSDFTDVSCGNCEDPWETVPGTVGVLVSGRDLHLVGGGPPDSVVIRTGAGYGVFFEGCHDCSLEGVTLTGGERDPDGRATNGAVVARDATLRIADCRIRDNLGDSATVASVVVGIAGIVGREGSELTVEGCRIENNSWDGVVLYRRAEATIRGNVIDGIESARGAHMGGGRGVGIGLTWDARATMEGNLVRNYWKGIGAFVDADAVIRENVVEDILTWGIAYWAAGDGRVRADIEGNAVFRTGACGVMIAGATGDGPAVAGRAERVTARERSAAADTDSGAGGADSPGRFVGNLVVQTAQDPQYDTGELFCSQEPVARPGVPTGFEIEGNLLTGNRYPGAAEAPSQLDEVHFRNEAAPILERLQRHGALGESAFLRAYGELR